MPGPKRLKLPGRSNRYPHRHHIAMSDGSCCPEPTGFHPLHVEMSRQTSAEAYRPRHRNTPPSERPEYQDIVSCQPRSAARRRHHAGQQPGVRHMLIPARHALPGHHGTTSGPAAAVRRS